MRTGALLVILLAAGCTQPVPATPAKDPLVEAQEKYTRESEILRGLEAERRRLNTDRSFYSEHARLLEQIIETSAPAGKQIDPKDVRELKSARASIAELDAKDATLLKQMKAQEQRVADAKAVLNLPRE